jgi:hypothetical protein
MRKRGLIAATALTVGVVAPGGPARADEPAVTTELRGAVGVGTAVGVRAQVAERLRAEIWLSTALPGAFDWFTAAVVLRVVGQPRTFLGLRAGYQLEYDADDDLDFTGSRFAHAVDGGLVGRLESLAGSAVEAQLGVEGVLRAHPTRGFDDAALPTSSAGLRVALTGELALSTRVALLAQAELRTGAHLLEIRWLPTAGIGARYRF